MTNKTKRFIKEFWNNDCFIIGGGEIYKQSLEIADKIYLTLVNKEFEGDTNFPELSSEWVIVDTKEFLGDENNEYDYSFIEYDRYDF